MRIDRNLLVERERVIFEGGGRLEPVEEPIQGGEEEFVCEGHGPIWMMREVFLGAWEGSVDHIYENGQNTTISRESAVKNVFYPFLHISYVLKPSKWILRRKL